MGKSFKVELFVSSPLWFLSFDVCQIRRILWVLFFNGCNSPIKGEGGKGQSADHVHPVCAS